MPDRRARHPVRLGLPDRIVGVAACAAVVVVAIFLGTAGCGVSASDHPVKDGSALSPGAAAGGDAPLSPPTPDSAFLADDLVRSFLKASVGGGADALNQVKRFLTAKARAAFTDPDDLRLRVIRIVGLPIVGASVVDRTPVTVNYQVVGVLNDQGRVDVLSDPVTRTTKIWVAVENQSRLRIDEIDSPPSGLVISDDALTELYKIQPAYFWDASNRWLVPDLRYLPLTYTLEQRAATVLQWLVDGPSPWLTNAQRLPAGSAPKRVRIGDDGTVIVNFNAQAAAGGPEGLRRLVYQMQWSLRSGAGAPNIDLQVEDKAQDLGALDNYQVYNETWQLSAVTQTYDITADARVVLLPTGSSQPAMLLTRENRSVVAAAVNRERNLAAFVRRGSDGRRSLYVARVGVVSGFDAALPRNASMGRPVWIPGSSRDPLLITSGGELYVVTAADGKVTKITPSRVGQVTAVAVSPDGRRVAFIADGQVYVAALAVEGASVTVGIPRSILERQLTARGVAWKDEEWLYVVGVSGSTPAMWNVTADGVVARNKSEEMRGLVPTDVVAYPEILGSSETEAATDPDRVIVYTDGGLYRYLARNLAEGMRAPFFPS
jgi:Sporulation and spore germination